MFDITGWVGLAPGEDERLRAGHLWVYKSEIAVCGGDFEDGEIIWVKDAGGRRLGTGFVNLRSVIAVRLLSRGAGETFNAEILKARLATAFGRRERIDAGAKRLVNAEGDLLPGLIVDTYGDTIVIQMQTLFWERRAAHLLGVIESLLRPRAVVLRNDSASRKAEGLDQYVRVAEGRVDGNVTITEGGLDVEVDVLHGHKTGFYIDQRDNRRMALPVAAGLDVLDCFCYTGVWSVMCAKAGARSVIGLDCSEPAVEVARVNARNNRAEACARFEVADVFDHLARMGRAKRKFGLIILDPPALAKGRKAVAGAARGYIHLNKTAMGLLRPGGYLATCSCSHHVRWDDFMGLLRQAAHLARKPAAVIGIGGQPADHPSLLGVPETEYLKCVLLRVG